MCTNLYLFLCKYHNVGSFLDELDSHQERRKMNTNLSAVIPRDQVLNLDSLALTLSILFHSWIRGGSKYQLQTGSLIIIAIICDLFVGMSRELKFLHYAENFQYVRLMAWLQMAQNIFLYVVFLSKSDTGNFPKRSASVDQAEHNDSRFASVLFSGQLVIIA